MPVNVFHRVIVGGVLNLDGGTGIYIVDTENGDPVDEIDTVINVAHPHIYELRVEVDGQFWTLNHNPAGGIELQRGMGFATTHIRDFIILRAKEIGSAVFDYWRGNFDAIF